MTLTNEEETILKKIVEIAIVRAKWDASNKAYQTAIRTAAEIKESTLTAEITAMNNLYTTLQLKETELKTLTGV